MIQQSEQVKKLETISISELVVGRPVFLLTLVNKSEARILSGSSKSSGYCVPKQHYLLSSWGKLGLSDGTILSHLFLSSFIV
jgi:hypothetical protein